MIQLLINAYNAQTNVQHVVEHLTHVHNVLMDIILQNLQEMLILQNHVQVAEFQTLFIVHFQMEQLQLQNVNQNHF